MSKPAITVEGLGKKYRLGGTLANRALKHHLRQAVRAMGLNRANAADSPDEFWALRDISFEVEEGQILGVIGRNGAGKSTLLKILSQITAPTTGSARIRGRVSSLLEVGTGFHPELTGRENIFLNGTILGMSRAEIRRKLDDIVDFSGVRKFIDTPVKRYSSGMYVRLAFSVATHLEPEILIVDEVLAVGDAEFQKKCLGRMKDVAGGGRTILFVSHNLAAVANLCDKAALLVGGRLETIGSVKETVDTYMSTASRLAAQQVSDRDDRQGNGRIRIQEVVLLNDAGAVGNMFVCGGEMSIALRYRVEGEETLNDVVVGVAVSKDGALQLADLGNSVSDSSFRDVRGEGWFVCRMPRLNLAAGRYVLNVICRVEAEIADWVLDAAEFNVESGDFYGNGRTVDTEQSLVLIDYSWHARTAEEFGPGTPLKELDH